MFTFLCKYDTSSEREREMGLAGEIWPGRNSTEAAGAQKAPSTLQSLKASERHIPGRRARIGASSRRRASTGSC